MYWNSYLSLKLQSDNRSSSSNVSQSIVAFSVLIGSADVVGFNGTFVSYLIVLKFNDFVAVVYFLDTE